MNATEQEDRTEHQEKTEENRAEQKTRATGHNKKTKRHNYRAEPQKKTKQTTQRHASDRNLYISIVSSHKLPIAPLRAAILYLKLGFSWPCEAEMLGN